MRSGAVLLYSSDGYFSLPVEVQPAVMGGNAVRTMTTLITAVCGVFGIISTCFAEPVRFGDWVVDVGDDKSFIYAATENSTGNVFGEYCYFDSESCLYLLGIKTACVENITTPVLINSDQGALSNTLICSGRKFGVISLYSFSDFPSIQDVAIKANNIGFALPLLSDEFSVVRFSLNGSDKAIGFMREIAAKRLESIRPGSESYSRGKSEERL
jgi:hypothetical protein